MENNKPLDKQPVKENTSKWKQWVKRFGIGGIIFFTVKGIITSTLIYFLGKNFWTIISNYFTALFD
ncbi:hypothetical protein PFY10_02610 [Chryseobacterium daecheongense]|nr:hypothetical protein PFY10_02610 [Chryseobacterium daecheongense]